MPELIKDLKRLKPSGSTFLSVKSFSDYAKPGDFSFFILIQPVQLLLFDIYSINIYPGFFNSMG